METYRQLIILSLIGLSIFALILIFGLIFMLILIGLNINQSVELKLLN